MKYLGRFLADTADQIFSTVIIAFFVYVLVKGVIAVFQSPPSALFILGLICFGFLLGTLKFFSNGAQETDSKDDVEG